MTKHGSAMIEEKEGMFYRDEDEGKYGKKRSLILLRNQYVDVMYEFL